MFSNGDTELERITNFRNRINDLEIFLSNNIENEYILTLYEEYNNPHKIKYLIYNLIISGLKSHLYNSKMYFLFRLFRKLFKTSTKKYIKSLVSEDEIDIDISGFRAVVDLKIKPRSSDLGLNNNLKFYNLNNKQYLELRPHNYGNNTTDIIIINNNNDFESVNGEFQDFISISNFIFLSQGKNTINYKGDRGLDIEITYQEEFFI